MREPSSKYRVDIFSKILHFKKPATTSRGTYLHRKVWYLLIREATADHPGDLFGIGEAAPLPDLSVEYSDNYEEILRNICSRFEREGESLLSDDALKSYPSILFALETGLRHLKQLKSFKSSPGSPDWSDRRNKTNWTDMSFNSSILWDSPFARGEEGIRINGLIWMGDYDTMFESIKEKLKESYSCIKIKIGALDFASEKRLLSYIRRNFSSRELEIRLDANGAFKTKEEAEEKLKILSDYDIHSMEQPIKAGQKEELSAICCDSPIPIALDEELIYCGCHTEGQKRKFLLEIKPQYLVLKPSLHGGILSCEQWIKEAEKLGIAWWLTSALESNIGLNAIAQWCATLKKPITMHSTKTIAGEKVSSPTKPMPQGLGTGMLYRDNIELNLRIKEAELWRIR